MSTRKPTKQRAVLVSWVSVNNGAAPLITALTPSAWAQEQRFDLLYLCWRNAKDDDLSKVALDRTLVELNKCVEQCPEIIDMCWDTQAPPTDHEAVRVFAQSVLSKVRAENPGALVTIHLSPGTPAMHAVWLTLVSTGYIDGPLKLIQTHKKDQVASDQSQVQVLAFEVDTWIQRYRNTCPESAGSDDAGHSIDPLRARSPALRKALTQLKRWAPLRVPVLLLGERGTGKTTLANLLRASSPFQDSGVKTWPSVVCGQFRVNLQLAQARLFGYERGAFTGADKQHKGLLERADGDSLFFDEIADLDRETQRMLMAAIEGRGFQRIGGTKTLYSNFRLICATNCCLEQLQNGVLDPDFFDRIGTFVLQVPPLRECLEDVPHFWAKSLEDAVKSSGVSPEGWRRYTTHSELIKNLQKHALPGNFRDLQRVAYHLLAELNADSKPEDVLHQALAALSRPRQKDIEMVDLSLLANQLPVSVQTKIDDYEFAWLQAALQKTSDNKSEAAKLLGLPRKTFDNRWKRLSNLDTE
ncbi:sigma-54-dependent transcriptional regulator [Aeromonas caviae]